MTPNNRKDDDTSMYYSHSDDDDGSYTTYTTFMTLSSRKTATTYGYGNGMNVVDTFIEGVNDIDKTFFACGDSNNETIDNKTSSRPKKGGDNKEKVEGKAEDSSSGGDAGGFLGGCLGIGCGLTFSSSEDDVARDDVGTENKRGLFSFSTTTNKDETKRNGPANNKIVGKLRIGKKSKASTPHQEVYSGGTRSTAADVPPLVESSNAKANGDKKKSTKHRAPRFRRAFATIIRPKSKALKANTAQQNKSKRDKYNAEAQAAATIKGRSAAENSNKGLELPATNDGRSGRNSRDRRPTSKEESFHRTKAFVQEAANKFTEECAPLVSAAAERFAEEQAKAVQMASAGVESAISTTALMAEAAESEMARVATKTLADVASTIGRPLLQTLASMEAGDVVIIASGAPPAESSDQVADDIMTADVSDNQWGHTNCSCDGQDFYGAGVLVGMSRHSCHRRNCRTHTYPLDWYKQAFSCYYSFWSW